MLLPTRLLYEIKSMYDVHADGIGKVLTTNFGFSARSRSGFVA